MNSDEVTKKNEGEGVLIVVEAMESSQFLIIQLFDGESGQMF
jgi:hypothetical protein